MLWHPIRSTHKQSEIAGNPGALASVETMRSRRDAAELRMPRFHFNVHDGRSEIDTQGTELPSREAARLLGLQLTGEIMKDEGHRLPLGELWCLEIADEAGTIICRIEVSLSDPSAGL